MTGSVPPTCSDCGGILTLMPAWRCPTCEQTELECVRTQLAAARQEIERLRGTAEYVLRMGDAYMKYHREKFGGPTTVGMTPALDRLRAALDGEKTK